MEKMKRIRFNGVIEIPEDTFAGEYDSEVDSLFYWAFEHGHGSGEFYTYKQGEVVIEDFEETE
ncbi:hypothetical protein ABZ353_10885 [Streptomyces niveus]|uniref:hypothetical protein n=1 Tax=Streptomyces niveus TaxID=193462 RepID=UPI0033FAFF90